MNSVSTVTLSDREKRRQAAVSSAVVVMMVMSLHSPHAGPCRYREAPHIAKNLTFG
jgi:hypothetical protein